jgi:hypothetical protein
MRRHLWLSALLAAVPVNVTGQSLPEQVQAKRPDGTVIRPAAPAGDAGSTSWWLRESAARADDRERARLESQRSYDARIEQSRREREAALGNPARRIPPTVGR